MVGRVEDAIGDADRVVVLAEGGSDVDQAGAVLGGDEVAGEDGEAAGLAVGELEDRALVAAADQVGAAQPLDDLDPLAEHPLDQRLGEDQDLVLDPGLHVADIGGDGDRLVAGQRPGRRRPDQQRLAGRPAVLGDEREPHVYGGVLDVLVAERHLVRGERRAAARAVGDDLVALVEAPLVPEPPQRPPDRLDVGVVEGAYGSSRSIQKPIRSVRRFHSSTYSKTDSRQRGVELVDPVLLDLLLGGDAELFFDLDLDRQPVAVPARLARHPVAAHRPVAGVDVLEDPGEDVVGAGAAVGGRRALVEAPDLGPLAVGERAGEDVALAPALEHPLLELGEGLLGVDGMEAGHAREQAILGARAAWAPHRPREGLYAASRCPSTASTERSRW